MRILVVDDDPEVVDALCSLIEPLGHEAVGVTDGPAALERFSSAPCDLVIVDLVMPQMNGLEVMRRLRTIDRTARIVAITGTDLDLADVLRASGIGWVRKPIGTVGDMAELIASRH